jgi:3D (Asp-Asp-Asp) domain-containing protein
LDILNSWKKELPMGSSFWLKMNLFWLQMLLFTTAWAQNPRIEWHKGYGTSEEEHVHEGWQTRDKGYIAIGQNDEKGGSRTNLLVVKTDSLGAQQWITELGTLDQWDVGICAHETNGGYLIGGGLYNTESGRQDRALVKLDQNGEVIWQKTYPGSKAGAIRGIDTYENGEIIATGYTNCSDGGYTFIAEEADGFLMKADATGTVIWDKPLSVPQGTKVRIEQGGGMAVVSTKWVYSGGRDHQDVFLIRTDREGNEIFSQNFGGNLSDQCFDFDLALEGGYILAGHTRSYGVANWDYLLIKIDSTGQQEWVKTFGQPRGYDPEWIHDESYGVRATPDGGYVIAGGTGDEYSYSASGHPAGRSDEWKAYLVKTNAEGNLLWEGVYPPISVGNNAAEYVALTDDGGFMVFTDTDSESPPAPNNFGLMKIETDTITKSRYIELDITIEGDGAVYPRNRFQLKDSALALQATPEAGWTFISWGGDVNSSENPLSIRPAGNLTIHATFQHTAGLSETRSLAAIIYPNPVLNGLVKISFHKALNGAVLSIYDLNGSAIVSKQVHPAGSNEVSMKLPRNLKGLYIMEISTDSGTTFTKLFVD